LIFPVLAAYSALALSINWCVGARKGFTRGTATGSPSVQHSLHKQPRGPMRKQVLKRDAADHSWHSRKGHKMRV